MFVAPATHIDPPSCVIEDGKCMVCELGVEQHKVIWVTPDYTPDFNALGLKSCWFETGGDAHHGAWARYICLVVTEAENTMDRNVFEELYG